ncbi:glycosyltransferase [Haloarcula sp. KBTZ06]|uniref:glycosyltransferase n=1 Tax=unclassified Haloarcula TaxID=2624677 RepID=UPI001247F4F9|nr:glycosyltransferase [Haloarcula sp. CBA1131]KAA9406600.1 glycosyltransferase [Haloarcula sp. CBA1131]
MASIGVIYPRLTAFGGAEAVCLTIVDALRNEHDVELITATPPRTRELSTELVGTEFTLNYRELDVDATVPGRVTNLLGTVSGNNFDLVTKSLFIRRVRAIAPEYDLLVSVRDDVSLPQPTLQYVHTPRLALLAAGRRVSHPDRSEKSTVRRIYNHICTTLAGHNPPSVHNDVLLTNSDWTRSLTREFYGPDVDIRTVYPPVTLSEFDPVQWDRRENGFVTIGRVCPSKRTLRTIKIVSELRDRGFDTHLHVIGTVGDSSYADSVCDAAAERDFVSLEGEVKRATLVELLTTHRYGIHGKEREPFGMSVVEMVGAGMIPFVPSGAGPAEILGGEDALVYDSLEDAVTLAEAVLENPDVQASLRSSLPDSNENYGPDRFKTSVVEAVEELV